MVTVTNVSYHVKGKTLLNDVSVTFNVGKLNLIIGPNGAGKSTLIKIISNQLKPHQGVVSYSGKDSTSYSPISIARIRAVLSQNIDLAFPLKVSEVVMMGRYPHFVGKPKSADTQACLESMKFFDVLDMANRDYTSLSGGEKQRVQFARVIAQI